MFIRHFRICLKLIYKHFLQFVYINVLMCGKLSVLAHSCFGLYMHLICYIFLMYMQI